MKAAVLGAGCLLAVSLGPIGCVEGHTAVQVCADDGGTFRDVQLGADPENCGCVGLVCRDAALNRLATCRSGRCAYPCAEGFDHCEGAGDGCETDLSSNPNHCGACGAVCRLDRALPHCGGGRCLADKCETGYGNCNGDHADGCETDLRSSRAHCGACGAPCPGDGQTGQVCVGGECRCPTGRSWCPAVGRCVDRTADVDHCGTCENRCNRTNGSPVCVAGVCTIRACNADFGDCDGDPSNGCEVDLRTSAQHCGRCRNTCAAVTQATVGCERGACVIRSCAADHLNCNGNYTDGCEAALMTNSTHCGRCNNTCGTMTTCQGGTCR